MLQNIRIVLVETSHTGNMGSVARAMKTMGLTNLWLVNPLVKPDSQAIALAPVLVPARCRGRCWTRANAA